METRDVPYYHGSDLQQGDVQELQAGQSVIKQTQQPSRAAPSGAPAGGPSAASPAATGGGSSGAPDYIELMAGRTGQNEYRLRNDFHIQDFTNMAAQVMTGSRSSGLLHRLFIRQLRNVQNHQAQPTVFDMRAVDSAIEESL